MRQTSVDRFRVRRDERGGQADHHPQQKHDDSVQTGMNGEYAPADFYQRARAFGTASLCDATQPKGALPCAIKPLAPSFRISGPAFPISSPGRDNLWLHRAIHLAMPGDVLVVYTQGRYEAGYWGEVMSTAAKVRHLGGLVIDGCVRDAHALEDIGFPVFARGLCVGATSKSRYARGSLRSPIRIGGVTIRAGDLVVGDLDGVVVVARERSVAALESCARHAASEAQALEAIRGGKTTIEVYGWPLVPDGPRTRVMSVLRRGAAAVCRRAARLLN